MAEKLAPQLEETLLCFICIEEFNSENHAPKCLTQCGHHLCLQCMRELALRSEEFGIITCPKCRQENMVPRGGVDAFSTNFAVLDMKDIYHAWKERSLNAVGCLECGGECEETELNSCLQCLKIICYTCIGKHHRTHECIPIREHFESLKNKLNALTDNATEKLTEWKIKTAQIDNETTQLFTNVENAVKSLNEFVEKLTACVQAEKDKCLEEISKYRERNNSMLDQTKKSTELQIEKMESSLELIKQITSQDNAYQAMKLQGSVNIMIEEVKTQMQVLPVVVRTPPAIDFVINEEFLDVLAKTGLGYTFTSHERLVDVKARAAERRVAAMQQGVDLEEVDENPQQPEENGKGKFILQFGSKGKNPGQFSMPQGIAAAPTGHLLVSDSWNHNLQVFDRRGRFIRRFGELGHNPSTFCAPWGITTDRPDRVVVAERYNNRIQILDHHGNHLQVIEDRLVKEPLSVSIDEYGRYIICVDKSVQIRDPDGRFLFSFGRSSLGKSRLSKPVCAIFKNNRFVVSDNSEHCVKEFDTHGKFLGQRGHFGNHLGEFYHPRGLLVDNNENIIVCDSGNHRIQVIEREGTRSIHIRVPDDHVPFIPAYPIITAEGNLAVTDHSGCRVVVFQWW